jgi:hypothetical protein
VLRLLPSLGGRDHGAEAGVGARPRQGRHHGPEGEGVLLLRLLIRGCGGRMEGRFAPLIGWLHFLLCNTPFKNSVR